MSPNSRAFPWSGAGDLVNAGDQHVFGFAAKSYPSPYVKDPSVGGWAREPVRALSRSPALVATVESGEGGGMKPLPDPHHRHRFPAELIGHAVWLYHVFSLSLRDVELILAKRGVVVSYESIRRWCRKFGPSFANDPRRRRPRPGDRWHLGEMFIRIRGKVGSRHRTWRDRRRGRLACLTR